MASVITPHGGLRLVAVLVMCCSILVHISAMDENKEGRRRREDQLNANQVSADGAKKLVKNSPRCSETEDQLTIMQPVACRTLRNDYKKWKKGTLL